MLDMNDLAVALEDTEAGGVAEAAEDETVYDICVVGFGGEYKLGTYRSSAGAITSTAIGAIYSLVLEKSESARVTAVCR